MGLKLTSRSVVSGLVFLGMLAGFMTILASCSRQSQNVKTVSISNVDPRRDVNGQIVDAHGGCVQFFNGRFYLYGNAFGTNHNDIFFNCPFAVYSSPNLVDWKLEGYLLKDAPKGVYYRPYVVFNPRTKKYVLWYNWYPTLWKGQAGVAESDSPIGPFVVVRPKASISASSSGDSSLFVDDDGTGYYIYTDLAKDYSVHVDRLTPDFLDSSGTISGLVATGAEAPLLIRRNNYYYVLCGPLCSDCPNGSEVHVFVSSSPLGPFHTNPSLNINTEIITTNAVTSTAPFIHAQETWVLKIPAAGDSLYIWMGDRWRDNTDGLIAHDSQYWVPLDFNTNGQILPLKKISSWSIDWSVGQ